MRESLVDEPNLARITTEGLEAEGILTPVRAGKRSVSRRGVGDLLRAGDD